MSIALAEAAPRTRGRDLALRHRYGDPEAFEEVYRRFAEMVFGLALTMSGDREEAADLTQETFLRVYRHLGRFRGRSSLKTWIYRITVNCCRTGLRKRSRRRVEGPLGAPRGVGRSAERTGGARPGSRPGQASELGNRRAAGRPSARRSCCAMFRVCRTGDRRGARRADRHRALAYRPRPRAVAWSAGGEQMSGHATAESLSLYLDAALPVGERRRLAAHLDACPECRQRLEGLRRVVTGLGRLPTAAPPEDLAARVRREIDLRRRRSPWRRLIDDGLPAPALGSPPMHILALILALGAIVYLFALGLEMHRERPTRIVPLGAESLVVGTADATGRRRRRALRRGRASTCSVDASTERTASGSRRAWPSGPPDARVRSGCGGRGRGADGGGREAGGRRVGALRRAATDAGWRRGGGDRLRAAAVAWTSHRSASRRRR